MSSASELVALCLGAIGMVGTAATTGLPMWRVTAFIQENIITMETRWEGLWMNCYRQANIRMQCKVYDSLLYLPPEMQAARGLMCTAVALSFIGLIAALPGLKDTACLQGQPRIKSLILMVAGCMLLLAAFCVYIPVSWTAHVIIQDFYNPLLLDAQRRELGEALYIGWVAGAFLFVSGVVFLICRSTKSKSAQFYRPAYATNTSTLTHVHPFMPAPSSISSIPLLTKNSMYPQSFSTYSPVAVTPSGQPVHVAPLPVPVAHSSHMALNQQPKHKLGKLFTPRNSTHHSIASAPPPPAHAAPSTQYTPIVYGYPHQQLHRSGTFNTSGIYI
ncbi:claudin-8-like [Hoplias malabaricus]|uniref:claudin-8-like n=1 Tax=Hoplias malabaricus TaxID=27720 RepID=UPI003462F2E8